MWIDPEYESQTCENLKQALIEYNEVNFKQPISINLFNHLTYSIIKIHRSLVQQSASTLVMALEGSGAYQMILLSIYLCKF